MPGFWKRPATRIYHYNLDLGEHYYNPMTSYLDAERGTRGETPGALSYSERLARQWLPGSRARATSELRSFGSALDKSDQRMSSYDTEISQRAERAKSEVKSILASTEDLSYISAFANRKELLGSSSYSSETAKLAREKQEKQLRASSSNQQLRSEEASKMSSLTSSSMVSRRRIEDDICKKVADIHMMPWSKGLERDEAEAATARARSRILDLEKELEEITKKAMSSHVHAAQSARMMAQTAQMEDEAAVANSYKRSKKVMIESSSKVN